MPEKKSMKIAVLGHGVVGSGTVEVFLENKSRIAKKIGVSPDALDIKYILDIRNPDEFTSCTYKEKFTKDFDTILNDPEVSIVAELIGGINPAFSFVKSLLEKGKSVVTSNKELVAQKGGELLKIARENNAYFLFEASVGGGIPIIRPLVESLGSDEITEIVGILNGTTNFILTKMFRDSMDFASALSLAQQNGYAERDPSDDVNGVDACRKICILSSIAFGKRILPESVKTIGITEITHDDIAFCESRGGTAKLIARVVKCGENVEVVVCPAFISNTSQLYTVSDVYNAVLVRTKSAGDTVFYGKGAGKFPTASAVVNDITNALIMMASPSYLKGIPPYWSDEIFTLCEVKPREVVGNIHVFDGL